MSDVQPVSAAIMTPASADYVASADGDFAQFYAANAAKLRASLRLRSNLASADVDDAVQEAFARVLVRWDRLHRDGPPVGYLYRTAFRVARSTFRREVARPAMEDQRAQFATANLTQIAVEAAIRSMPRRRREVAILCLVVGLTPDEAAKVLRMRPATARVHLHDARKELTALDIS